MKSFVVVIIILAAICLSFYPNSGDSATSVMPVIPQAIFINGGHQSFKDIINNDRDISIFVKQLYHTDQLPHKSALYYKNAPDFSIYWKSYSAYWSAIKLQPNSEQIELIFNCKLFQEDSKQTFELYSINTDNFNPQSPLFRGEGVLLAYKTSPNTGEIVLYIHDYPCCNSAGHNIVLLRVIEGVCKARKRFFVARDRDDIKGPFFPEIVNFPEKIHQLKEPKELLWSPEKVEKNAFIGQSDKNLIGQFRKGSYYYVLNQWDKSWQYVLLLNGINDEPSAVLNPVNFKNRPVFGFIAVENWE